MSRPRIPTDYTFFQQVSRKNHSYDLQVLQNQELNRIENNSGVSD